jgi:subtilase family serine protease
MRRLGADKLLLCALLATAGCVAGEVDDGSGGRDRVDAIASIPKHPFIKSGCNAETPPGVAHCLSLIRTEDSGSGVVAYAATPDATAGGLGPSDIKSAYALNTAAGAGITVAIVDAQDDPNAEKDLATYRSNFGLPACTTANGCFKKVNQSGQASPLPSADSGWAGEIALDLDMVSAACPNCKILLVEATSANMDDLGTAVNTAVSMGAAVVSNSYGGSEDSTDTTSDSSYFNHPGVGIFVSSGDSGYGVEYPAASIGVTAVGGTSLTKSSSSSRGWVEAVWGSTSNSNGGAGSGCSAYDAKPSWQKDTGCSKRTVADVSAVADPNTGVAVYDSYGSGGWIIVGGTSAAAPLVAGMIALWKQKAHSIGAPRPGFVPPLLYSLAHRAGAYLDIATGTNVVFAGVNCCSAGAGFDLASGLGSPMADQIAAALKP